MSVDALGGRPPQDIVAIFHASFHPTQGNIIDWSLKASEDLTLDNLEFSALPSGLHLVEEDVIYFTKDGQQGVCVFRRRKTVEQGHRGFRLSSLGILLARSDRPRPWRHTAALKELTTLLYSRFESNQISNPKEEDWAPARDFFNSRKVARADLNGAGDWSGWSSELLERLDPATLSSTPTLHLPHLLRILGPSSLILHKHVVGRRRILIYTLPPVEAASILCHVAADMAFELQVESSSSTSSPEGRSRQGINVLGMITLMDLDMIEKEGKNGRGWVACTTDAIFLEKPSYYDLLIDLTTLSPLKATRPTFYASKPVAPSSPSSSLRPQYRLSVVRFSWSDVKLWNELNRLLQLDSSSHASCCSPASTSSKPNSITAWTDAWRVYEDVCVICAGLWMGAWRGNSTPSYSTADGARNWGSVRLEGDEDFSYRAVSRRAESGDLASLNEADSKHVRSVGLGIEGGPRVASGSGIVTNKAMRRTSAMSWASSRATVTSSPVPGSSKGIVREDTTATSGTLNEAEHDTSQVLTTLSLLQTLHAHTTWQIERLGAVIASKLQATDDTELTIVLTPRDLVALELGALSSADAKYLEWLGGEYALASRDNVSGINFVVKRGWKEILSVIFGYG
ncbi:hypothetical protein MIND_01255400 [Mycena indigotica]|uniref:Protein LCHN n=1 Tax=Mycena indigotica TaxID=2126181 RepID=A0A8H6VV07_9AGAR|nr:uncharacterized protein MIND_01255400 [Mycena indigotica]KAF7291123.1 hypothetical protein MIND_01255400 [Mycena indigotica]